MHVFAANAGILDSFLLQLVLDEGNGFSKPNISTVLLFNESHVFCCEPLRVAWLDSEGTSMEILKSKRKLGPATRRPLWRWLICFKFALQREQEALRSHLLEVLENFFLLLLARATYMRMQIAQ